jgi:hypothetical protein
MMELITIIGAACVDSTFRKKLFINPGGTAEEYGFQLTLEEVSRLETLVAQPGFESDLAKAGERTCPVKPCWFTLAKNNDAAISDYRKVA